MTAPAVFTEPHSTWCIWTKTGHRPKRFHATREEAETEAARLARENPGKRFIVMQMVAKIHSPAEPAA